MRKTLGILIGTSSFDNMIIFNQEKAYIQASYVTIIDKFNNKFVCEITDCYIQPYLYNNNLPQGVDLSFFNTPIGKNFDPNKTSYFAKIKVLNNSLSSNIEPNSIVYEAEFDELKNILIQAEYNKGFNLGIINGTEYLQEKLPKELSNIAPLLQRNDATREYHAIPQNGVPYIFDFRTLFQNPHIGLFGSSGSGKSQAMKVIQEECALQQIPYLCFDCHNEQSLNEFREEIALINPKQKKDFSSLNEIFYIGRNVGIPFEKLNLGSLTGLFGFLRDGLSDSMKNVLQLLYEDKMPLKRLQYRLETLVDALTIFESKVPEKQKEYTINQQELLELYGNKVGGKETVRALLWRLNLLEQRNVFCGDINEVVNCIKKRKGAIIRGNTEQLKMIGYYIMSELYYMRLAYKEYNGDFIPPFFIFIDEAHNFAPEGPSSVPTKTFLRTLALESRKYGVFLCLATQRAANLDKTLLTQINNKIIFRIVDANDLATLKEECNLTERELSRLPNFKAGHCYLVLASQEKKFYVRFRATFTLDNKGDNPFDELSIDELTEAETLFLNKIARFKAISASNRTMILNELEDEGLSLSLVDFTGTCDILTNKGYLKKEDSPMGSRYLVTDKFEDK